MSEKFYMSDDTIQSSGLFESNLLNYLSYSFYVENRNNSDEPLEGNFFLYNLFDDAISCLNEENEITISEEISSQTEILSTNNFEQITSIFGTVTPEIDYEGINALVPQLSDRDTFGEISSKIFNWIGKFVNLSINRNPENADESNLILVQSLLNKDIDGQCYIQKITEALLNKIFRNLIQLIRVKHDYRLYGKGSTVFGGKAPELSSDVGLGLWSGLNPSCWTQFSGNYVVGKSAYGDDIASISSTLVGTFDISPATCYGIAPHVHSVSISKSSVPKTVTLGSSSYDVVQKYKPHHNKQAYYVKAADGSGWTPWRNEAKSHLAGPPLGFVDPVDTSAAVVAGGNWSYSWNSKNCKLSTSNDMKSEIFQKNNTVLPTYSSYVWQWTGEDDTNITSPRDHIK